MPVVPAARNTHKLFQGPTCAFQTPEQLRESRNRQFLDPAQAPPFISTILIEAGMMAGITVLSGAIPTGRNAVSSVVWRLTPHSWHIAMPSGGAATMPSRQARLRFCSACLRRTGSWPTGAMTPTGSKKVTGRLSPQGLVLDASDDVGV